MCCAQLVPEKRTYPLPFYADNPGLSPDDVMLIWPGCWAKIADHCFAPEKPGFGKRRTMTSQ